MKRISIRVVERLSDQHEVELCQVNTNAGRLVKALKRKFYNHAPKYVHVRYVFRETHQS
jgi:hypothetical protein